MEETEGSDTVDGDDNHPAAGNICAIDRKSVHRICSGQVVLTLATAVKELLENSIDAGATIIDIKLKDYGSEQIEVCDNGGGVHQKNFEGLTLKHHTSKLQDFSDLINVETFGFRGEALSSLCALSDLSIATRHKEAAVGTKLEYDHNGKIVKQSKQARQIGTTVTLQNLFCTLPVRHKEFQRNLKKEFVKMVQVLNSYCIISTGVRITCTNQTGKGSRSTVVSSKGNTNMLENISNVFGPKQSQSLLEFKKEDPGEDQCSEFGIKKQNVSLFGIEGYISKCDHGQGRSSTDRQFFFINGRPFDSTKLSKVVNEVYHQYNRHQYPFVVFKVTVQKDNVDVNVTPDKRQVFLEGEKIILATVKASMVAMYEPTTSILQYQLPMQFTGKAVTQSEGMEFTRKSKNPSLEKATSLTSLMKLKRSFSSAFSKEDSTDDSNSRSPPKLGPGLKQRRLDAFVSSHRSPEKRRMDSHHIPVGKKDEDSDVIFVDGYEHNKQQTSDMEMCTVADINEIVNKSSDNSGCKLDGQLHENSMASTGTTACSGLMEEINETGDHLNKMNDKSLRLDSEKKCMSLNVENHYVQKFTKDVLHDQNSTKCVQNSTENVHNSTCVQNITESVQNNTFCVQKDDICVQKDIEHVQREDDSTNDNTAIACVKENNSKALGKEHQTENSVLIVEHQMFDEKAVCHQVNEDHQDKPVPVVHPSASPHQDNEKTVEIREYYIDSEEDLERKERTIEFSMDRLKKQWKCRNNKEDGGRFSRAFRATISPAENQTAEQELQREIKKDMFAKMDILGQFNLGFIITKLEKDLFIVDQHATDEKFNFETLQRDYVIQSQKLICPLNLELTSSNEIILMDNIEIFRKNGFEFVIDDEGPPTQRVKLISTPVSKNWNFGKEDIEEMIFMLTDSPGIMCRPSRVRAMFASRACRKSIMIGTTLNKAEMQKLVGHMGEIEQPWNCPHGRPTMRHLINLDMVPR